MLPKVLVIGDSIAQGYMEPLARELSGLATVVWHENAGDSTYGLASLDEWLGDEQWDVILFNHGLHDMKLSVADQGYQVNIKKYEKNLDFIVARLKRTGARLIFATTTPIVGSERRRQEDVVKYNDVALRMMKHQKIDVCDLYAHALPQIEDLLEADGFHFKENGSEILAQEVARHIMRALAGFMGGSTRPRGNRFATPAKVLIVGDSIAQAYIDVVARELRGRATVYWRENAGDTVRGIERIDSWIGTSTWDIIYFNHGLHDLKLSIKERDHEVPVEEYGANLEKLILRLEETGATLMFATTTPVLESKAAAESRRRPEDVDRYNAAAMKIMVRNGVILSDLNSHISPDFEDLLRADGVHFKEEGAMLIGQEVGKHILQVLNQGY